jgi:hypothetical protein
LAQGEDGAEKKCHDILRKYSGQFHKDSAAEHSAINPEIKCLNPVTTWHEEKMAQRKNVMTF